jgi:hypothetical protein
MRTAQKNIASVGMSSRFESSLHHFEIGKEKLQQFKQKRKLYSKERKHQTQRKLNQELRLSESRQTVNSQRHERFATEYERIDHIEEESKQKRTFFATSLRRAVDEYNRLSLD